MDFSKFSDDNFDVKDWINNVFRSQNNETQREAYTATLVTKLQRYIQEVNKSLEEVSQQTVTNLPRVLRDVETLKQEASFLWQQMQQVKNEIESVEEKTSHSMQVLVSVDKVKHRVKQTCSALKEADNWSSLASAIEDIFRSGDVQAVSKQLQSMKTSLEVLKNSPDYEDKLMHLEALKNRLETSVSPSVVAACIQHNTEQARQYYSIFSNMERVQELVNYYLKCHRGRVGNKWQEIVNKESDAAKPVDSNCELLGKFYELLLDAWHSESQWCTVVFGREESIRIVVQLLLEVTLSVDSGPAALISTTMAELESDKLLKLISLHDITHKFTLDLHKAIKGNKLDGDVNNLLVKFSESLWLPYAPHFLQYAELETEALLTSLSAINLSSSDMIDLVQVLDSSVKKVFDEANAAIDRCNKSTGFLAAGDLAASLGKYFNEFCDRFSRELRTIAISCGLTSKKKNAAAGDHDDEDWTIFQHCVRVITTCGRMLLSFADFEGSLAAALLPIATKRHREESSAFPDHQNMDSLPWENYDYLKIGGVELRDRFFSVLDTVTERSSDSSISILSSTKQRVAELNQQAQKLTFDVAFAYVKRQLSTVSLQSHVDDDVIVAEMPRFSVSPSESATRVGQYLMTLPQHLESFASLDVNQSSEDIDRALEVALLAGRLPFPADADLDNMADQWLSSIIQATEHTYVEAVTHIERLTPNAARQIVADLDYMRNVVDSLGMNVSTQLNQLRDLLDADSEDEISKRSVDMPRRLVDVVAKMRDMKIKK